MITAINVAYVGIIGFIGMVIPQLIRKWQWKQSLGRQLAYIVTGGQIMVMEILLVAIYCHQYKYRQVLSLKLVYLVLFYMLISQSKRLTRAHDIC
ncbi:iron chelate uptake ABC transporter family permease subunit [Staphylococcus aureus]